MASTPAVLPLTGNRPPAAVPPAGSLPAHIGIIMDGNGRWARSRGWLRTRGHEEGADSVRTITRECARLGIEVLTLYAFSSDNWRRPRAEVSFLLRLLKKYLVSERREIMDNDVRLRAIGEIEGLPSAVRKELDRTVEMSRGNRGLNLILALNYGGRREILRAVRRIAENVRSGRLRPEDIDAALLAGHLDTAGLPDPDLIIRTGGEMRLSGFLLWQVEYAEFWSTSTPWPEFREEELHAALRHYAGRERRYGGLVS